MYSRNGDAVTRKVCEALHDALRVQVRGQIQPQDIQPGGKGKVSPTNIRLTLKKDLSLITFTNHNHERTLWCGADCGLRTSVACRPRGTVYSV